MGRVGPDRIEDSLRHFALDLLEEVLVAVEGLFLAIGQSIITYILQCACSFRCGEGIGLCGLRRYLTPLGIGESRRAVDGQTALIKLLAVLEHILRHLAEIDIEVAAGGGLAFLFLVDERVEHPKLDILDVGLLEVVGVETPHHAAPVLRGVVERTVVVEVRVEVVRSPFVGVVGDVHHRERGGSPVVTALVALRIELAHIDLTHVRVGEHRQVALDIRWCQRGGAPREERVDGVPRHL